MNSAFPRSCLSSEVGLVEDKKCLLCGLGVALVTAPRGGMWPGISVRPGRLSSVQPVLSVPYVAPGCAGDRGKPGQAWQGLTGERHGGKLTCGHIPPSGMSSSSPHNSAETVTPAIWVKKLSELKVRGDCWWDCYVGTRESFGCL